MSSLRSDDVDFSAEDTAELLATVEESIDQLTALVGNLLDSSRLAAGVVRPELRRVYLEEAVQRALLGISGRHRSGAGLDRVKVEVGDAVVMADSGLLERVLVNLIDNALRYAPDSVVRVNAGQVGDRVLITVADEGPGIPRAPKSSCSRRSNGSATATTASASALACPWRAVSSRRWAARSRPPTPPAVA